MRQELPRLVFISDVPVGQNMRSGSEALARLLGHYPADKVTIIQTQGILPALSNRVTHTRYIRWALPWDRLLHTRLTVPANILKTLHHMAFYKRFAEMVRDLSPDLIVTLIDGNGWILAQRAAAQLNVPLHLIIHDGPEYFHLEYPLTGGLARKEFISACGLAASRWSICAALDNHIERMTNLPGNVLMPLRKASDKSPNIRVIDNTPDHAVYFGGLSSISISQMLNDLALELARVGGKLHVFGGVSPNVLDSSPWRRRAFDYCGPFMDRDNFLDQCRVSYKFMFLPFSFDDDSRKFSFPSKLIDYMLCGLPILVQAPASSPLGTWCAQRLGATQFVGEKGAPALRPAVEALIGSASLRRSLAEGAVQAGEADFAFAPNWRRFIDGITGDDTGHVLRPS